MSRLNKRFIALTYWLNRLNDAAITGVKAPYVSVYGGEDVGGWESSVLRQGESGCRGFQGGGRGARGWCDRRSKEASDYWWKVGHEDDILFCLKAIFGFCWIVDNPSLSGRGYRNFLRFPNKILQTWQPHFKKCELRINYSLGWFILSNYDVQKIETIFQMGAICIYMWKCDSLCCFGGCIFSHVLSVFFLCMVGPTAAAAAAVVVIMVVVVRPPTRCDVRLRWMCARYRSSRVSWLGCRTRCRKNRYTWWTTSTVRCYDLFSHNVCSLLPSLCPANWSVLW